MFKQNQWIVWHYRDSHGTLRTLTGLVKMMQGSDWVIFVSDGGQRGYPRSKSVAAPVSECRLSESPYAPNL